MRTVALLIAAYLGGACCAGEASRWNETVQMSFVVEKATADQILSAADAALVPLGFSRIKQFDSVGGTDGVFGAYNFGETGYAAVTDIKKKGCVLFAVTIYDKAKGGLVSTVAEAVKSKVRAAFGRRAKVFSDSNCKNAL